MIFFILSIKKLKATKKFKMYPLNFPIVNNNLTIDPVHQEYMGEGYIYIPLQELLQENGNV